MNPKKVFFILSLLLFGSAVLFAQVYSVDGGKAFFKAKTPLISYMGNSGQLQGKINFETGVLEFSLPVKSIKTGIDKRDSDMYKLLNVDKNPNVIFKGRFIEKYDPTVKTKQVLQVKGDFTLAGTTRNVIISIDLVPEGEGIRITSSWALLITEYNIKRPSKAFFKVEDKHELGINALLVKE